MLYDEKELPETQTQPEAVTIPGFTRYTITPEGLVFDTLKNKVKKQTQVSANHRYVTVYLHGDAGKPSTQYLHRLLATVYLPNPNNLPLVDHISRVTTDNSLNNLRWVSYSTNVRNVGKRAKPASSDYLGVHYRPEKKKNKWQALISPDGKRTHLGYFECEQDAARAYNERAKLLGFDSYNQL